jgi:hypothetical protein
MAGVGDDHTGLVLRRGYPMLQYLCALPNVKGDGHIVELYAESDEAASTFVSRQDRPGWAVYRCVSPLKPGLRVDARKPYYT